MVYRFYAPVPLDEPRVELTGAEAQHLLRVLRLKVGDDVALFDGGGHESQAEIAAVTRNSAELRLVSDWTSESAALPQVILATAVPKGDRFRWLVEKATELGVRRLVPLITERSVVDPGAGKLEKMQQTVIAACKQCGRNTLMEIAQPTDWEAFASSELAERTFFVAHPDGTASTQEPSVDENGQCVVMAVGPEGGWTEAEIDLARQSGARLIGLGDHMLRIETAAVAFVAWFVLSHR